MAPRYDREAMHKAGDCLASVLLERPSAGLEVWLSATPDDTFTWEDMGDCVGAVREYPRGLDASERARYHARSVPSQAGERLWWDAGDVSRWGVFDAARKAGASVQVAREREAEAVRDIYRYVRAFFRGDVVAVDVWVQVVADGAVIGSDVIGGILLDLRYDAPPAHRPDTHTAEDRLRERRWTARPPEWPRAVPIDRTGRILLDEVGSGYGWDLFATAVKEARDGLDAMVADIGSTVATAVRRSDALTALRAAH